MTTQELNNILKGAGIAVDPVSSNLDENSENNMQSNFSAGDNFTTENSNNLLNVIFCLFNF